MLTTSSELGSINMIVIGMLKSPKTNVLSRRLSTSTTEIAPDTRMLEIAIILARLGIERVSCQLVMIGPNTWLLTSQL